jgi:hypothetical protein
MKHITVFIFFHILLTTVSAVNIKLTNDRYELDYDTETSSYIVKETKSGVTRTFSTAFYVVYRATKPTLTLERVADNIYLDLPAFGDSLNLFAPTAGAFTLENTPTSVNESAGIITLAYPSRTNHQLSARIYLPAGDQEPVVESSLKSLRTGYFAVGFYGSPELNRTEIAELYQSIPYTGKRVPITSTLTPAFLCTLPGTFLSVGLITYGVFADPDEFPFMPLPNNLAKSRFGVALKNRAGFGKELKPMVWAPIIGNNDSYMSANATKKFKFRPYVTRGSMTATYEDIARRQFGFGNFRNNDLGSLNKTMHRMIDYAMTTEWGVFIEDLKGANYSTDVKNSVKNISVLPKYSAAFIADRADIYEKRALPVLEFLLSRENDMYAEETTGGAGGQVATNTLGKPCMNYSEMLSFYNITNKSMAALLTLANENKKGGVSSNISVLRENFSLYNATQNPTAYNTLISGVTKYINEELNAKPIDFRYGNHPKSGFWNTITPNFAELFQIYLSTGNESYLQAARDGARIFAYHIWMSPRVVPGDSVTVNIGNVAPRYRTTGGTISIPQEKAPVWRLSEMGLHSEATNTCTGGHRAVFTANHASTLLRIGSLTKDTFLLDIAKNAVIGRYTNFPGYHINTDRTTVYEKSDFPMRTTTLLNTTTSMHYNHVWPQINLMFDYMVSDVAARTLGAVDFPGHYVQNLAHMQSQVYTNGGKFYGDQNLTLWMPKDIVSPANEQLNFISAYGNGKFYIVFTNQNSQQVNTTVTINSTLLNVNGKSYAQWQQNISASGGFISGNQFTVSVAPHGVTAIAIDGVDVKTKFQQKLLTNTLKNRWNKYYEPSIPVGASRSILLNPSDSLTRLYVFSTNAKGTHTSVKLQYSINKGNWQELTDNVYPFEFSVDINTATSIDYKVIIGTSTSEVYTYERQKPTAVISGWNSIKKTQSTVLPIHFTGLAPYEIKYSENGEVNELKGIQDSVYLLQVNPQTTSYYKLLAMKDADGTEGIVSGDAKVVLVDAYEPLQKFIAKQDAQTHKTSPTLNYGAASQLELKGSISFRRDLFYSFDIPALALKPNQRALINLWVNSTLRLDAPYLTKQIVATKFSDTWLETTINWSNQPAMTQSLVLDTIAVSYQTTVPGWINFDITNLVKQGFSGNLNLKVEFLRGEDVASIFVATKESSIEANRPYFAVADPLNTITNVLPDRSAFSIFPTIINNYFEVKGTAVPAEIAVFDITGNQLLNIQNQHRVNTSTLATGVYLIVIRSADNQIFRMKIIKQS